ncbi:MAG: cupin domain-containing protein [Streptosporangiaceae bacterium]
MSGIFSIDPQAALQPDPANPGEYYVNNFTGAHPGLFAGVWSADEQETFIESYPVDEVCVVLAGSIILTAADGRARVFKPGDAFAIRKGSALTWANSPDVRKIYVILDHAAPGTSPTG